MIRPLFHALIASWLLMPWGVLAAEVDVCTIRPDLCDRHQGKQGAVKAKAKIKRKARHQGPCREADDDDVNRFTLPLCRSSASAEADAAIADNIRNPSRDTGARRRPASRRMEVDFDAYIAANSGHSAFASRTASRQQAFQETRPAAIITLPKVDGDGLSMRETPPAPDAGAPGAGH